MRILPLRKTVNIGDTFGHRTVIETGLRVKVVYKKDTAPASLCQCSCGRTQLLPNSYLRRIKVLGTAGRCYHCALMYENSAPATYNNITEV